MYLGALGEAPWRIGAEIGENGVLNEHKRLKGSIDDLRVWNRKLTDEEMKFNRKRRVGCGNGMMMNWRMDDGFSVKGNASHTARELCNDGAPFLTLANPQLQWTDPIVPTCHPQCTDCVGPELMEVRRPFAPHPGPCLLTTSKSYAFPHSRIG